MVLCCPQVKHIALYNCWRKTWWNLAVPLIEAYFEFFEILLNLDLREFELQQTKAWRHLFSHILQTLTPAVYVTWKLSNYIYNFTHLQSSAWAKLKQV